MKQKPASFYVPVNLDSRIVWREHRWYPNYFLDLIHWRGRCCWRADQHGYVPLNHDYLVRVIRRQICKQILKRLWGEVVDVKGGEEAGQCRRYRLRPAYRDTRRLVCEDESLNQKLWRIYQNHEAGWKPVHHWPRSQFEQLEFDAGRARQYPLSAEIKWSEQDRTKLNRMFQNRLLGADQPEEALQELVAGIL